MKNHDSSGFLRSLYAELLSQFVETDACVSQEPRMKHGEIHK